MERIRNNPAVVYSLIEAVIVLGVAFGLELTAEQAGAVMAAVALLTGVGVRQVATGPVTADRLKSAEAVLRAPELQELLDRYGSVDAAREAAADDPGAEPFDVLLDREERP